MAVLSKLVTSEIIDISEQLYTKIQVYKPITFFHEYDSGDEADFIALTEDFIHYSSVGCNIVTLKAILYRPYRQ